ncbi:MAG: cation:proton antiporter [Bacteroidales bacterium]
MNVAIKLPFEDPILIFSLIIIILFFVPVVLRKIRIPHIIGLILAGAVVGPNGFDILARDTGILLFGTAGLLYIMFLAGLEMDMAELKTNKNKSIVFGLFTFSIPMIIGTLVSFYVLNFTLITSVLLASMFASHTLIAYPIVSRYGVVKNRSVTITVGGTIITDTLALMVLAVIVKIVEGELGVFFWLKMSILFMMTVVIILVIIPRVTRWYFKNDDDQISQFIFVMGIVFLSGILAWISGVEPIIGAFLSGVALNRLIPRTSPLMNRIEFIGNSLFIPFFLISVGMIVDYRVFLTGPRSLIVAFVMTVIATLSKFLAAWFTAKSFRYSKDELWMIFGLSNAQAAATLAAVMIGYNIILGYDANGNAIRLLNDDILNGTIIMILVTCTHASFAAYRSARNLALTDKKEFKPGSVTKSKFLIPISNPNTVDSLIQLGTTLINKNAEDQIYALNIVSDQDYEAKSRSDGMKLLERAVKTGAAANTYIEPLNRHDINVANAIIFTMRETEITDLIIGLHQKQSLTDSHLGYLTEALLSKSTQAVYIFKPLQPLNTCKRLAVVVPTCAEFEFGFRKVFERILTIARQYNFKVIVFASDNSWKKILEYQFRDFSKLGVSLTGQGDWQDYPAIAEKILKNDMLVFISSRKKTVSYNLMFEELPIYLDRYFKDNSLIIIYPELPGTAFTPGFKTEIIFDTTFAENISFADRLFRKLKKFLGLFHP